MPISHLKFRSGSLILILLVIAAAFCTVLGGCGRPNSSTHQDTRVVLRIWWSNWGQLYNQQLIDFSKRFTKENPDIKLEITFIPNAQVQEKLLTAIAGGVPPDVAYVDWKSLPSLASKKALTPLEDYARLAGWRDEDFVAPNWKAVHYNGHIYAVPGGADFMALYWNKDIFREVGLDPEVPPRTLQELSAFSDRIVKYDADGKIVRMGMQPGQIELFAYLFGGKFYDEQSKRLTANCPKNVEALEWIVEIAKHYDIKKIAAFNSSEGQRGNDPFITGRLAFQVNGFWQYEMLDKYSPKLDYGVTYLPTVNGTPAERSEFMTQGWDLAIPRGSKKVDAAWRFIKWTMVDHAAEMGALTGNGPTTLKALPEFNRLMMKKIGKNNRMARYLHVFEEAGVYGKQFFPVLSVTPFYFAELQTQQEYALYGSKTPRQALDDAQSHVEDELARIEMK